MAAGLVAIVLGAAAGSLSEEWSGRASWPDVAGWFRPLAARLPGYIRLDDSNDVDDSMPLRWSAPPFITSGAVSDRPLATDAAGLSCAPAEREIEALPAPVIAGSRRVDRSRGYVIEETPVPDVPASL